MVLFSSHHACQKLQVAPYFCPFILWKYPFFLPLISRVLPLFEMWQLCTAPSVFKTIEGIQNIALYGTYSCVSLWQSLCIFKHTFGRLPNWSLFSRHFLLCFLMRDLLLHILPHYLSTLIANALISRSKFLLNALLHTFLLQVVLLKLPPLCP